MKTIKVDGLSVRDEEEGLALMVHHLELAAQYFYATPAVIRPEDLGGGHSAHAMMAWVREMEAR